MLLQVEHFPGFPPIATEERDASQAVCISALLTEDQHHRDRGRETTNQQTENQLQPTTFTLKGDKSLLHSEM